jgi:hypothetical protein
LHIAVSSISEFLMENDIDVYLVVFDRSSFKLSEKLFAAIERYIDDNYVDERMDAERFRRLSRFGVQEIEEQKIREFGIHRAADEPAGRTDHKSADESAREPIDQAAYELIDEAEYGPIDQTAHEPADQEEDRPYEVAAASPSPEQKRKRSLEDVIGKLDETFSQMLLRLIDEKGTTDVETYKRANIDRRLFSKIRSNKDYKPSKPTAIALAIALRLNLDETLDLLARAGYTLSFSSKFDVIIRYFIKEGNYDIFEINEALFVFEQDLLGA